MSAGVVLPPPGPNLPEARTVPATTLPPVVPIPRIPPPAPPRRAGHWRRWVLVLAGVLAAAAAVEGWRTTHAAVPVQYVTAAVTRGAVTRAVTASGSVNPVTTIQVGTYVSGVIQALYCDYNTPVRKGQLCARIDPRPYQTIVDQDTANLATANAQLQKDQTSLGYAKLTLNRTSDLRARAIVSQDALDSARSTYDQAAAQIELDKSSIQQRQAELNAAQINLAYTNIVSPVTGVVVSRAVTMGQTVAASFQTPTLFLIATDLTKMQVDANVSEGDVGGIALDDAATFTVEAFPARVFDGRVVQIRQAPQTVQNVVTYDVVISVPNADLALKPGMTATIRIVTDLRTGVVRVPDTALRYTPAGVGAASAAGSDARAAAASTRVWVLRDGRPVAVPVVIGLDDDTYSEVVRGELQAGAQVIVGEQAASRASSARRPLSFRP